MPAAAAECVLVWRLVVCGGEGLLQWPPPACLQCHQWGHGASKGRQGEGLLCIKGALHTGPEPRSRAQLAINGGCALVQRRAVPGTVQCAAACLSHHCK